LDHGSLGAVGAALCAAHDHHINQIVCLREGGTRGGFQIDDGVSPSGGIVLHPEFDPRVDRRHGTISGRVLGFHISLADEGWNRRRCGQTGAAQTGAENEKRASARREAPKKALSQRASNTACGLFACETR
jgi:hypothetical protein